MPFTDIEQEALKLPENERATLAQLLLSSLAEETATGLCEERWADEAERRYQEYRADKITARPAAAVFEDAHRRLK
ncbi:MAG: addiction module protein [Candidatus Hydrogenedentes bacterium]|nr:addiction module protein [Candidatus Hydrogenedentota bacterium]